MPTRLPETGDFPPNVTVVLSYPGSLDNTPPPTLSAKQASNVLVLLHGLGDNASEFSSFGRALNLPETVCVTVQAPTPLPEGLVDRKEAYHWGNDVIFDNGRVSMDAGFDRARQIIVHDVVTETLLKKYGYKLRDILFVGFGQGGMAALDAARELGMHPPVEELPEATLSSSSSASSTAEGIGNTDYRPSLSGVVSFGAPYPLSSSMGGFKDRTPVLILAGRDDGGSDVSETAVKRTKEVFEFVEVHRWSRPGDGMPRNREEMLPVMQFFARRLKSRKGVPSGSIELT